MLLEGETRESFMLVSTSLKLCANQKRKPILKINLRLFQTNDCSACWFRNLLTTFIFDFTGKSLTVRLSVYVYFMNTTRFAIFDNN